MLIGKSQVAVDGVGDPGDLHPYFKRPGKGHNHDCCDSCGEGGALICCDFCPASFHLQCHDPPLEDLDIPDGDWMCIKCFTSRPENQKLIEKARLKPKSPVKVVQKPSNKDDKPGVAGVAPLVTKVQSCIEDYKDFLGGCCTESIIFRSGSYIKRPLH